MTLIQIIAEVEQGFGLKNIHASTHASQTSPSSTFSGLTPREIDVLRLVAEGLTDRQIAEKLVLSSRTIGTHLRSVYNKLGVSSRAMATRFAVEHQLLLFLYLS